MPQIMIPAPITIMPIPIKIPPKKFIVLISKPLYNVYSAREKLRGHDCPQRSLSIKYKGRIAQMAINVAAILINDQIYFISIPFMCLYLLA